MRAPDSGRPFIRRGLGALIISSCQIVAPALAQTSEDRGAMSQNALPQHIEAEGAPATLQGDSNTQDRSRPAQLDARPSAGGAPVRTESLEDSRKAANTVEEVVVTAQRREETLQKSSLALQVLGPAELANAGVTNAQDLTTLVPGLQVGNFGSSTQIYIRGVGELSGLVLSNPAVATHVDGVYLARAEAVAGQFYDLARIEVLKGPQGTLYGRNSTGGAINIITNRPSLTGFNGYLNLEGGNYAAAVADGAINVPLGDTWAARGAFQIVTHRPYLSDHSDDAHQKGGRVQALWQPSERLSVLLQADFTHFGGHGGGASAARIPGIVNATAWTGVGDPRANAAYLALANAAGLCTPNSQLPPGVTTAPPPLGLAPPPACAPGSTLLVSPFLQAAFQDNDIWGTHAELTEDLEFATLTVIPAYRSVHIDYWTNLGQAIHNTEPSNEETLEVRLGHVADRLKWVLGGYYYRENQAAASNAANGLLVNNSTLERVRSRSSAGFGEATVSITDSARIIGGLRFTHDSRYVAGATYDLYADLACSDPTVPACFSEAFSGIRTFNQVTWKGGFEHDLAPDKMLYATASTGFKAGGINDSAGTEEYKPEKILAFEFGSHNTFLHQRLQLNAEAFYWKYQNQQNPHVVIDALGNPAFNIENAGKARLYGLDLDLAAKPTAADSVRASVEYLDSRYQEFTFQTPSFAAPVHGVSTGCQVAPGPINTTVDCAGYQLLAAPLWSGSAALEHRFGFRDGSGILAHIDSQFASPRWVSLQLLPQARVPSYIVETITLGYEPADDKWSLTAFCRNLTNRAVYTTGTQDGFVAGWLASSVNPPRTYGLRGSFKL
jgi:iron complex outermembrane recepter protein